MSASLTATIESLHITAAQKLLELIQTEKDSRLLARLIATAFRYKAPQPAKDAAATHAPPSPAASPCPDRAHNERASGSARKADDFPHCRADDAGSPEETTPITARPPSPARADVENSEAGATHNFPQPSPDSRTTTPMQSNAPRARAPDPTSLHPVAHGSFDSAAMT